MGKIKLDEAYMFKMSIKMRFFRFSYWYQNSIFFRVLVTIEPGRSLLQFVTTNCLIRFLLGCNYRYKHDDCKVSFLLVQVTALSLS